MQSRTPTGNIQQSLFGRIAALLLALATGLSGTSCFSNRSSKSQPHDYQAYPEATVKTMFGMFDQFKDNFSTVHLLDGKDSSADEQRFAELFWDNQRSGVFYSVLYDKEPELQSVSLQSSAGNSAIVNAAAKALATSNDSEKSDRLYLFELRKRGANWCIYELRSNQSPTGVFEAFQKANAR